MPHCDTIELKTRLAAVLLAVVVRTWSQGGRLFGHLERGRLICNIFRRFNWFGHMWDGAIEVERAAAMELCAWRVVVVAELWTGWYTYA